MFEGCSTSRWRRTSARVANFTGEHAGPARGVGLADFGRAGERRGEIAATENEVKQRGEATKTKFADVWTGSASPGSPLCTTLVRQMLDDDRAPRPEVLSALPIFPLPNAVLLPGMVLPLNVFEPRYLDLVDHVLAGGRHIGVPLLCPGYEEDYAGFPDFEPVFGVGRLLSHQRLPDGRRFIRLEGLRRVRALHELPRNKSFREVACELLPEDAPNDLHQLEILKAQLERICTTLRPEDGQLVHAVLEIPDARVLLYAIAAIVPTLGLISDAALDGRSPLLDLQQRCMEAECADERAGELLECAAAICDVLSDTGRFPRMMLN